MKKFQQGFTLIELMIVVAIIGILAAVAIPAYQDYTVRARMAEALSLASSAKTGVSEFWATNDAWPTNNTNVGLPSATSIFGETVASVGISGNGLITVTMQNTGLPTGAAGETLLLTPTNNAGGAVGWSCTGGTLNVRYRPTTCRP